VVRKLLHIANEGHQAALELRLRANDLDSDL